MARLVRDGEVIDEVELKYAGRVSTFEGEVTPPETGSFQLVVLAMDPANANFGRVVRDLSVMQ